MIKKYLSLILLICCFSFGLIGNSQCSDLFISEYIEGSGNNKYLEIYNPTNAPIDFDFNYEIRIYSNGAPTANTVIALYETVAAFDVFIIANSGASMAAIADRTSGVLSFNGNDAVALLKNGTIIDVIGQIGTDPGSEWSGTTCSQGTANGTLVRNSAVQSGDADGNNAFNPDIEWTCFAEDDISNLGSHTSTCLVSNEIQLQLPIGTDISCGFTNDFGTQNIGDNSDIVVRVQNTGTLDLDITNLSFATGINFSIIGAPTTPFTITGGAFQDITVRFTPSDLGLFNDSLTITNTDSNEGSCFINLIGKGTSVCGITTQVIAAQDFESATSDTWNYTAIHAPITDFWYVTNSLGAIASAQSNTNFWGMTDLERSGHQNQTHELIFDAIDISSSMNVELSFYYYTDGIDSYDSFEYELSYDGVLQGRVDISDNTLAWENVSINIPDTVNSVGIIFYPDIDAGLGFDQAGLDNLSVTSSVLSTATWDGTNWNWNDGTPQNTMPSLATTVVIDGNYDTSVGGFQTSFSACSLTVNGGNTLTIANDTFIEVQNDIVANGNINCDTNGSVVQIEDSGSVSGTGEIVVTKTTPPMNNWYEYTYWSSPTANTTINNGLTDGTPNRRFLFNAQNYLDAETEMNNDNSNGPGQDDIDDNGDDWTPVIGSDIMMPGIGYASTHRQDIFNAIPGAPPYQFDYNFEGFFNNGIITVPIYRNDSETGDTNWNFIGNPYPSAIDADLFLSVNASIDQSAGATTGAIFFWSQNTPPDGNTNGNEILNFAQSDYAIINGIGETQGGDGVRPSRFIPSGQGFFVAMDDAVAANSVSGDVYTADVIFDNSMRVTGNNNLFFRNNNSANKLWLNLTSDNGIFNQILVAYVDGATDNDDGMYYDTRKNLSSDVYSEIYSVINSSSEKKFAIQGKALNSLDIDEAVTIGFNTSIDVPTLYTISIDNFTGSFLSDNNIYLKDNLLNTVHNLKDSDYNFTSEVGEFNNRFEIVFRADVLSVNDNQIKPNQLTLIELANGNVEISVNQNIAIKTVEILDITGRQIYNLTGSNSTEAYNLSKLSKAAYIARVTLSNGQTVTKKAIKQN